MHEAVIELAAEAMRAAEAILIGAGAGMSVDAGIPAYRLNPTSKTDRAGPPSVLGALTPILFRTDPEIAWGRAGYQLSLFRRTPPHRGYQTLLRWARRPASEAFVLTSNVDGMFSAAGVPEDRVLEGHGSMHFMQCTRACTPRVWSAAGYVPEIDAATERALPPVPPCPDCGEPARPNVFMFGDQYFNGERTEAQAKNLDAWLDATRGRRFVVIECGAGTAVPTIRRKCTEYAERLAAPHIRINVAESDGDEGVIRIPMRALEALERLDAAISTREG